MTTYQNRLEAILAHFKDDKDTLRLNREIFALATDLMRRINSLASCIDEDSQREARELQDFFVKMDRIASDLGVC